ncbi:MAG: NAD(P)/FAD-dependent oxidoreductase [bacterium]|nr:NAD(P)/FAD-dependent oxidoreductase [bacterium]
MYDVVIVGSGPGGYETAFKLKNLSKSVCLIEKSELGGTCLNRGCIPTKTMITAAKRFKELNSLKRYGITLENISFDYPVFRKFQKSVISRLRKGLTNSLVSKGVDLLQGEAKILDDQTIIVNEKIKFDNLVIATGSRPFIPKAWKANKKVIDAEDLWSLEEIPKTIAIIGGGVIGCEYASMLASLDYKVSLFEKMDTLLSFEEPEISESILKELRAQGVTVMLGTTVEIDSLEEDLIICAMGRIKNIEGFEDIIENKNVFLAGDVKGGFQLAHKAYFDAEQLANIFANKKISLADSTNIPAVIFTNPEISRVGLRAREITKVKQVKVHFAEVAKAVAENVAKGFILMNIKEEDNNRIVGMSILGSYAGELNSTAQLIIKNKMTVNDLKETVFSHPTISEIFKIAAERV